MKAETQRNIIIVLIVVVIGILLFPERIRQAVLEVVTTEAGRDIDSESGTRPEPQRIHTVPKAVGA